ncbi:hypothetical protein QUB16_20745 [Microcoleus sp. D3_18a_C4]
MDRLKRTGNAVSAIRYRQEFSRQALFFWTLATQMPNSNLTACSQVYT